MRYSKQLKHQLELKQKHQQKQLDSDATTEKIDVKAMNAEHHDAVQLNVVASSYVGIFICLALDLMLAFMFNTAHIYLYGFSLAIINCFLLFLIFVVSRYWIHNR